MNWIARKSNIQGDIWPGLPKRFQTFLFFKIKKPGEFKQRLRSFVESGDITTADKACEMKDKILAAKLQAQKLRQPAKILALPGVNIAFASTGLAALGKFSFKDAEVKRNKEFYTKFKSNQLRGGLFRKGMYDDLVHEGWDNPQEIRDEYTPSKRLIDGVFLVTSSLQKDLENKVNRVKEHFLKVHGSGDANTYEISNDPAVQFTFVKQGKTRPEKGKEHFGFEDGISQPLIEGLDEVTPKDKEPKSVKSGSSRLTKGWLALQINLREARWYTMKQPDWAEDGSFLVFRDLQQLVPEFDKWLEDNKQHAPNAALSDDPKEKLAAYLMGRWKNGTPVHENPHNDKDKNLFHSNNFDFHPVEKHDKCPFAAHIRKMRPRGDLDHDHSVIIRRGISYGGEVTPKEKLAQKSDNEKQRGLLFVCYQSDIREGFNFLTTRWASNHHFPDRKDKFVGEHGPGIDAIVGQRQDSHPPRSIGLPDGKDPTEARVVLEQWVIHRGGEYFFSPSIKALKGYLTDDPDYPPEITAPRDVVM
ncbi:913b47fc-6338-4745-ad9f-1369fef5f7d1 [Sclerotinia trifoliorum]|uniref:913b47fc-6338-4745-ad9f-1369fef5f7d1 n=1 Tax=Sclerotinia trifoliorum TaxID=28548 RepID=A0A8H2VXE1_9HELO|nr:913b47fc-6338-4745-ad9f-1369fef5f7d1 [Sclerotinia trifoliorum]